MKKLALYVSSFLMAVAAVASSSAMICSADNPIVQSIYTADPAPMVYGDTMYVYTSHDEDKASYFEMRDWHCYSTTDMQNWTEHGAVLGDSDFPWAEKNTAWAPQCIERNGKFYMYVPFSNGSGGGRAIGVAVSDSPTGPFKDAIGKPLLGPNWDYIDPTVFIDDDGQAYLIFGNPQLYYVKLNEDMISYSGQIQKISMTTEAFGVRPEGDERHPTLYEEGPWLYKRSGLYYLVYAASGIPENICYSTASSPVGPWKYGGVIMPRGEKGAAFTNHPGVCDYKGRSYFFYHNQRLPGGGGFTRSVAVEEFSYNPDGSFPTIHMSESGPAQIEALNPYKRTEAETICFESGIETENCSEGGINVANIENGDYIKVSGVDFREGAQKFTASVASSTSGGTLELHLDSKDGKLIGSCTVDGTGGWQNWKTVSCDVTGAEGEHDLYLVFKGGSGFLYNIDWWKFSSDNISDTGGIKPDENGYYINNSFEAGTEGWTSRGGAAITSASEEKFSGEKALFVSGRTSSWNGALKKLSSDTFVPGQKFSFSVNVMQNSGETADISMTIEYTDASGEVCYPKVSVQSVPNDEWVHMENTEFMIPEDARNVSIYFESPEGEFDFYVDDFIAAVPGTVTPGPEIKFTKGDINSDGVRNVLDYCLALNGLINGFDSKASELAADTDGDGKAGSADLIAMQKFLLGIIDSFE